MAVAFGVGALAEHSVALLTAIKLAGGAYLLYLGARTFLRRKDGLALSAQTGAGGRHERGALLRGAFVGATNPKTVVFLAAILPQFGCGPTATSPHRSSFWVRSSRPSRWPATACGHWEPTAPGRGSPGPLGASSSSTARAVSPSRPSAPPSFSPAPARRSRRLRARRGAVRPYCRPRGRSPMQGGAKAAPEKVGRDETAAEVEGSATGAPQSAHPERAGRARLHPRRDHAGPPGRVTTRQPGAQAAAVGRPERAAPPDSADRRGTES